MSVATRILVLGPASRPEEWARALAPRPPQAILSAPVGWATRIAQRLAEQLGLPIRRDAGLGQAEDVGACLDRIAGVHDERATLLCVATPEWMAAALRRICCVDAQAAAALQPAAATSLAFDWPRGGSGTPALFGMDLDWLPPEPAERASRYPGGPGAAASGKA